MKIKRIKLPSWEGLGWVDWNHDIKFEVEVIKN